MKSGHRLALLDPLFNPSQDGAGDNRAADRPVATKLASRALVSTAYTDFWQGAGVDRARQPCRNCRIWPMN